MLIDKEWINIFKKYDIGAGISLDGTKEVNDLFRLDKRGRSTYSSVVEKIKLCQDLDYKFGLLSVVNPEYNGAEIYNHFVNDLKLDFFDFLLPDFNHSSPPPFAPERYGKFMIEVFDEWIITNSNKPEIFIRFCLNAIELFYDNFSRVEGIGKRPKNVLPLICVSNNGDLGPLDDLRSCVPEKFIEHNIKDTTWSDFINKSFFKEFLYNMDSYPTECENCFYKNICSGGNYSTRFNPDNKKFDRSSIYCEGLKDFWQNVASFLIAKGYPKAKMESLLFS